MTALRAFQPWTSDDDELERLVNEGWSNARIAVKLGRSEKAVESRRRILSVGMAREQPQPDPWRAYVWFEDMPQEVIQREWPCGVMWNWRKLLHRGESLIGNAARMCVEAVKA